MDLGQNFLIPLQNRCFEITVFFSHCVGDGKGRESSSLTILRRSYIDFSLEHERFISHFEYTVLLFLVSLIKIVNRI